MEWVPPELASLAVAHRTGDIIDALRCVCDDVNPDVRGFDLCHKYIWYLVLLTRTCAPSRAPRAARPPRPSHSRRCGVLT